MDRDDAVQPQPPRARGSVGAAVDAAGGVALAFNTIAVSDNQSQATPGMRASLISREVIADSIELMVTPTTSTPWSASSAATRPCPPR